MLDLVEKIAHITCGLVVLTVGTLYALVGTPDTDPPELLPQTKALKTIPKALTQKRTNADGEEIAPVTTSSRDSQRIVKEVQKYQRVSSRLERQYMEIHPKSFQYARREANWVPELKKAGSQIIKEKDGATRLKITKIRGDSLLTKVAGLQAGDTVELINGDRWNFSESSSAEMRSRAMDLFETLDNGGTVSVTVTRGGKPHHLTFFLPQQ